MSAYVDLNGIHTWYETHGEGDPLVMLHPGGAGVDSRALGPNVGALASRFRVYTPERRAHGHTPDADGPITFEGMARDTVAFLEQVVGGPAHLVGSSDGAIVALLVAVRRPELVRRLVVVAGPFHHDGWVPSAIDTDNVPPDFLARSYAEVSPDGAGHHATVVEKLAHMHLSEPSLSIAEVGTVAARTLVMLGDDDEVILEHAIAMYRALEEGELMVVPGTSHGLLVEKPELCNAVILDFLTADPLQTMAPIRRAVADTGA
jgi:pimeloyl-ACP methyl ester carboxylesterase